MTAKDSRAEARGGPDQAQDPHRSLHGETGALPAERPGRSGNPLIKAAGLAWLEFEKPDLDRAERFGTDFGFTVADQTPETLLLRGRQAGAGRLVVRRGPQPRFAGVAFQAAAREDLDRLASAGDRTPARLGAILGGMAAVTARRPDPALTVIVCPDRVVAAAEPLGRLPRLPWHIPATSAPGYPATAHPHAHTDPAGPLPTTP